MKPSRTFKLWHSILIIVVLIVVEWLLSLVQLPGGMNTCAILLIAVVGALVTIYIATEVVEEVKGGRHMLILFSIIVGEFVAFFAVQYWLLGLAQPGSFPSLGNDPVSFLLNSLMIFVFNPLYLPASTAGRALLIINTFGALGLVLFVLQNIGAFRRKSLDAGTKGFN